MIYTVTLNPALDKTAVIPHFAADRVNRIQDLRTDPGGKGINVSRVLESLGMKSTAFALLGGSTGRTLEALLKGARFDCEFIFGDFETRTNLKIRDPEEYTNTDINEPGSGITEDKVRELMQKLTDRVRPGDSAVISGSIPAGISKDTYRSMILELHDAGAEVFLDADGEALARGILAHPDFIKPNREELEHLCGRNLPADRDVLGAALNLYKSGIPNVIVSLGGDGALFLLKGEVYRAGGVSVPVRSTVGAGDSMAAAAVFSTSLHRKNEDLVRLCIAASAASVECEGTEPADMERIKELLPKVQVRRLE